MATQPTHPVSSEPSLGREIRFCPEKKPGQIMFVVGIISTVLGLLAAILLMGISGAKSTKPGDLTFVAILVVIFLGTGVLLLALRHRAVKKYLSVRVFEHGVVRSCAGVVQTLRFADAAKVEFGRKETTFSMWIYGRNGGAIAIDPDVLENVDNTLASFVKQRVDHPGGALPAIAATPASGDVIFRAGAEANPPLLGPGMIEVTSDGVRLVGSKARTALPVIIGCAVGVMGVVVAAIVMSSMNVKLEGRGSGKLALLIAAVAGLAPGWFVHDLLRKRMRSRVIDVVVPWSGLLLFKHRTGGVGASVTMQDLRGSMEIVAQNEAAGAALAQLAQVGSHAEFGFSA